MSHVSVRRPLLLAATFVVGSCAGCPPADGGPDSGPPPGAVVRVLKAGDGTGSITSAPEGVDCDTACDDQTFNFGPEVTAATLTAEPARDALFESWTCEATKDGTALDTVVVDTPLVALFSDDDPQGLEVECTASFRQLWTLLVVFSGTGSGHITGSAAASGGGTRIDCPDKCVAGYFDGDVETLTAVPDPGSVFVEWKLDCSGAGTASVTLDEDKNCEAHFCPDTDPGCP